MSNKVFQQNLDDEKGLHPGGPFLIQMLFKEPVPMPDKAAMTAIMEKHIGPVECFCHDKKTAGFAALDHIAEFKDAKAPVQLMVMGCNRFEGKGFDDFLMSQMWDCMEDRERIFRECQHQVVATDMLAAALPALERANLDMDFLDALAELYPTCEAFYLQNCGKLFLAEDVRSHQIEGADRFIRFGVNVRFFNIQGTNRAAKDSSTCTAACIEFDLAKKEPAEFTRFVEGLTSPDLAVEKTIDLDNLADKTLDAIWLLNIFEIPHEETNFNKIKTTLKPDKNVLLKVGLNKRNPAAGSTQRNTIDTILQSTFMNVGSQQSYDSLTDRRAGNFKVTERGLIEYEKTFVESVVRNKNIISVNYQKINSEGEITGYAADFQTIKSQLLDTLNLGENIVAGITQKTKKGKLRGHEIVITGARTSEGGKTEFICYNSDLDKTTPVTYSEDYLLPKIHHAGIPKEVVLKTMGFKEGWIMELENYRALKDRSE